MAEKKYNVLHAGKGKSLSEGNARENERRGWSEENYREKNRNPTNNYDWSRHSLNFEILDGKIIPLGGQPTTLYSRFQLKLKSVGFKAYKDGATNAQNTYVEIILSADTEKMQKLAFGEQKVDYERNPEEWHNWNVSRLKEIEEWAMDCYDFIIAKYGKDSVIGFEVHLDETEPHIHVNLVPIAVMKQRGKDPHGFIKIDKDGNDERYTKGKHIGELKKISKAKYDKLSDAKKTEYRPAERGTLKTISYAFHFGSSVKERSEKMSQLHDEFYEVIGKKWGFSRGEVWAELTEEERRQRKRKTKEEAAKEKAAKEATAKAKAEQKEAEKNAQMAKEIRDKALAETEEAAKMLNERRAELQKEVGTGAKIAAFFGVGEFAEIRTERDTANKKAEKAVKDKEKAEKALREANEARDKELTAAKAKSRQEGYSAAIEDVKRETALVTKNTAKEIGEAVMASLSRQGQLQEQIKQLQAQVSASKNASVAIAAAEKKAEIAVANTLQAVNQILSHHDMPRLTTKNMEEAMAIAKASPFRVMLAGERERQQMCNSILEWGFQRKRVLEGERTPAAIALLQKLWQAMKDIWQRILNSLQEMRAPMSPGEAAEFLQKFPNVQLTSKAAMADIEQQLRFTPGTAAIVEGWQNAMQQTETQFMGQFRSERTTKQVQQHEQADTSLDVEQEQEQTRTAGHHR